MLLGAFRRNGAVVIDVANLASRLSWFQAMPLESKLFLSKDLEKIRILGAILIFFFLNWCCWLEVSKQGDCSITTSWAKTAVKIQNEKNVLPYYPISLIWKIDLIKWDKNMKPNADWYRREKHLLLNWSHLICRRIHLIYREFPKLVLVSSEVTELLERRAIKVLHDINISTLHPERTQSSLKIKKNDPRLETPPCRVTLSTLLKYGKNMA